MSGKLKDTFGEIDLHLLNDSSFYQWCKRIHQIFFISVVGEDSMNHKYKKSFCCEDVLCLRVAKILNALLYLSLTTGL